MGVQAVAASALVVCLSTLHASSPARAEAAKVKTLRQTLFEQQATIQRLEMLVARRSAVPGCSPTAAARSARDAGPVSSR